ncbi:MAG: hypothetical protein LAT76_13175, partial [Schleiferiaceae bacterium]|nr:hypothetical protein [Schleiferiaceae bacterium]
MKTRLLILLFFILKYPLVGQTPHFSTSKPSTFSVNFYSHYSDRAIIIYPSAELGITAPGFISSIYLYSNSNSLAFEDLEIGIGTINQTKWTSQDLSSWPDSLFTTAFTAPWYEVFVPGPTLMSNNFKLDFTHPYFYDGQGHLVLSFTSKKNQIQHWGLANLMVIQLDSTNMDGISSSIPLGITNLAYRLGMDTLSDRGCQAPSSNFQITANDTLFCHKGLVKLQAPNSIHGHGVSYQWEKSVDQINWVPLQNDTGIGLNFQISTAAYYRLRVICGIDTVYSAAKHIQTHRAPLSGGTYTINQNQPVSTTNFNTFQELADFLNCGRISGNVFVEVASGSGPYVGSFTFDNIEVDTGFSVSINGNGETVRHTTILDNQTSFGFINVNNFKIKNLTFSGTHLNRFVLVSIPAINNFEFKNCHFEIDPGPNLGIAISQSHPNEIVNLLTFNRWKNALDFIVDSCSFIGGFEQISLTDVSYPTIANSSFSDFHRALNLRNCINLSVRDNHFEFIDPSSGISGQGSFSRMRIGNFSGLIYSNVFTGDPNGGRSNYPNLQLVDISSSWAQDYSMIFNNVFKDIKAANVFSPIRIHASGNLLFSHNTFDLDDTGNNLGKNNGFEFSSNQNNGTLSIINNIFKMSRKNEGPSTFMRTQIRGNLVFDHNIYFFDTVQNHHTYFILPEQNGTPIYTFGQWQQQNTGGLDQNSLFVDPEFVIPEPNWRIPYNPLVAHSGIS